MGEVSTIGLDLAKSVFQAHGADEIGKVVFRKKLRRDQVLEFFASQPKYMVAMEACASAHFWARELASIGHTTKLIAPNYVKPFVKRQKNDMADAEAICEAAQRPTMRLMTPKSAEAQAAATVFRARDLLVRQRTQLINALRGHLAEYGMVLRKGADKAAALIELVSPPTLDVPEQARSILEVLAQTLEIMQAKIATLDAEIAKRARADGVAKRLMSIPGVGAVIATALAALAPEPGTFKRGRDFAAWIGLTPLQHSSGGKERLGRITKMGERSLWLIGEHRSTGERKYSLSNLAADASLKTLAGAVKARWACEQAHQQLKEELGLDHFEGRSWIGLHRHALMAMIAYAFLQSRRLKQAGGKKKSHRPTASAQPAGDPTGDLGPVAQAARASMSALQNAPYA